MEKTGSPSNKLLVVILLKLGGLLFLVLAIAAMVFSTFSLMLGLSEGWPNPAMVLVPIAYLAVGLWNLIDCGRVLIGYNPKLLRNVALRSFLAILPPVGLMISWIW